jgi:uncharacterized lipoprotein YajG
MNLIKRHSWLPALLMLVMGSITLALGGCATNLTTAIVPPPTPLAMAVRLCDSAASSCVSAGSFSLASIRDLNVNVDWQNVPGGTHTQQLAMVLPNGVVYQTISQGFGIAEGTVGSPTVSDAMPVAGTFITQRQLTGDWTVQISLDGAVVGSQKFALEP